jgi:hypothetical protein
MDGLVDNFLMGGNLDGWVGVGNLVQRLEYCTIMRFRNFGVDVEGNHSQRQAFACRFGDLVLLLPCIVIRTSESNQTLNIFSLLI